MIKIRDLLRLKYGSKLPHRMIGRALNISAGTVSYYSQAAKLAGLNKWPLPEAMDDSELIKCLEPLAKQLRGQEKNKPSLDFSKVRQELSQKHMTLMLLWEQYRNDNQGNHYSYSQFTRHYKTWCKKQKIHMRLTHKAGEKGFIDYAGTTVPIHCRKTGGILFQAQIFIMALGASHYTFAYASRSQKLADWIDAHKRAFRFFGGVPDILVPDNLKSGITDSCQFEPEANPTYADMARHYQTAIIPARPATPQDKSIAENAVLVASRWMIARLLKQRFYSLSALNSALSELLESLNKKPFQKREGSRLSQFIELEKKALNPLPQSHYEYARLSYHTVSSDYHIRVDGHYYSIPFALANERVLCRMTQNTIEVLHQHTRVSSHVRSFEKDGTSTIKEHMPKHHQDYAHWSPELFNCWAQQMGAGVSQAAQFFIGEKQHHQQCSKIHYGLKSLVKKYGKSRLDKACRRAIALQCINYKSICSILEKGLDKQPYIQSQSIQTPQTHQNLRGPSYYQNK